jgi:hypothetical protein
VQTPLSDDSAGFSEEDDSADFSELLEDSGTFSDDESAELELDTDFAELLEFFAELDKATEQLDRSSIEDSDDEEPSPTAAGELSESPHATSANGTTSKPASTAANNQLERDLLFIKNATLQSCPSIPSLRSRMTEHLLFKKLFFLIYIKKTQPGEAAFSYLKLRDWSFIYRMQNQVS